MERMDVDGIRAEFRSGEMSEEFGDIPADAGHLSARGEWCPDCGGVMVFQSACRFCPSCGFSRCG